MRVTT